MTVADDKIVSGPAASGPHGGSSASGPSWREADRLAALQAYGILDTPREKEFDEIAALAAAVCETPIAVVNLVTDTRMFLKAEVGLGVRETSTDNAFCAVNILRGDFMTVPDATLDPRFNKNPLVSGEPHLRFYAGAVIRTESGLPLGTVSVIDTRVRALSPAQEQTLRVLAHQVMTQLDLRRSVRLQAERALVHKASEERARLAQEAGRIGTFEVHIATGHMIVSDEMCRVFGLPERPTYHAADFEALVLKDDRDIASSDETRRAGVAPLDVSYRVRRADDGRIRWVTRRSQIMMGADGKPERMFGAVYDSTDMRAGQALVGSLLQAGDAFRQAHTSAEVVAIAGDVLGRVLQVDRAGYARIDLDAQRFDVEADWSGEGVTSVAGAHAFSAYGATARRLMSGEGIVVPDLAEADWLAEEAAAHAATGTRALLIFPVMVGGRLVGSLFANDAKVRQWTQGEIAFIRSLADRTHQAIARVDAEEQQKLLNHELSHRLKNTLAVVQAIADQTIRHSADADAMAAFRERLRALGTAHDVLMNQSWSSARMQVLAEEALALHAEGARTRISGPHVQLGPRAALALSLLLHELATNAVKYGALSTSEGVIDLDWTIDPTGLDPTLHVKWQESGGPAVASPARRGFGSRLIGMGLGSGTSDVEFAPGGLIARFTAPMRTLIALD